jgi:F-type H+-transporting ATPase subunit c
MESQLAHAFSYLAAGIGAGLVTIGAGYGIGRITGAAVEATGRQPEAANDIRLTALIMSALIEGVALFSAVTTFLLAVK